MKVTLEQIDELRNRVNVSYEEAKSTLEKNDGDLIKSIIELEKRKSIKKGEKNKKEFTSFVDRLLQLKFLVKSKGGDILLNIPVILVLAVFVMAFWVVIFGLIIAVGSSCKMKIYRDKNSINVHGIKKNMQQTVEKIKVKTEDMIKEEESYNSDEDIEENEIIIE